MLSEEGELQVIPEQVMDTREGSNGELQVLIKWFQLPDCENSWESAANIEDNFPDFHLEDKVALLGGSIVSNRPPVKKVYFRRRQTKRN